MTIACVCVLARVYTKAYIMKSWFWDDVTCGIAFLGTILYMVCTSITIAIRINGVHIWNVSLAKGITNEFNVVSCFGESSQECLQVNTFQPEYIRVIDGNLTLGCAKLTFFLFFYRLFRPIRAFRICNWLGATFTFLFYLTGLIAMVATGTPRHGETFFLSNVRASGPGLCTPKYNLQSDLSSICTY